MNIENRLIRLILLMFCEEVFEIEDLFGFRVEFIISLFIFEYEFRRVLFFVLSVYLIILLMFYLEDDVLEFEIFICSVKF